MRIDFSRQLSQVSHLSGLVAVVMNCPPASGQVVRPLSITLQPQSQTVVVDAPVAMKVIVTGTPAFFQWQKDGFNLSNETRSVLWTRNAASNDSGGYRVIVTNSVNSVTSDVATLTVLPDLLGPRLIAAIWSLNGFSSNRIVLAFSEPLNADSARATGNYVVSRLDTSNPVTVLSALYSTFPQVNVALQVNPSDPDWRDRRDYKVTVSNVKDIRGNPIAPGSELGVSRINGPAGFAGPEWSHHVGYWFEPTIYDQAWEMPEYVETARWFRASGPFCLDSSWPPTAVTQCSGLCQSVMTGQMEPALFRTTFAWPTNLGSSSVLTLVGEGDDALFLYLNGLEVWRSERLDHVKRLSATDRWPAIIELPVCRNGIQVLVTNLVSGTNWIAVGVMKALVGNRVQAFGLNIVASPLVTPSLPGMPAPQLNIGRLDPNLMTFAWTGGGYVLESSTNLSLGSGSYPHGPWLPVGNRSNPHTNVVFDHQRFFRLKK